MSIKFSLTFAGGTPPWLKTIVGMRLDQEGMEQALEISEIKKKNQEDCFQGDVFGQTKNIELDPFFFERVNKYRYHYVGLVGLKVWISLEDSWHLGLVAWFGTLGQKSGRIVWVAGWLQTSIFNPGTWGRCPYATLQHSPKRGWTNHIHHS